MLATRVEVNATDIHAVKVRVRRRQMFALYWRVAARTRFIYFIATR